MHWSCIFGAVIGMVLTGIIGFRMGKKQGSPVVRFGSGDNDCV